MPDAAESSWTTLWRSVTHFDAGKIAPLMALRNAIGVMLPLAVGAAIGQTNGGLIGAIGALNVSFSDGADPYPHRARRMAASSLLVALAVAAGGLGAHNHEAAVLIAAGLAFAAGMMSAIGPPASDLGNGALVTFIVFSAHPVGPRDALLSGAIALAGGLLQAVLALALWPLHPHAPERAALARLYAELAAVAAAPPRPLEAPVASGASTQAQNELASLEGDHSVEAERLLALLSQAERIRLALVMLGRVRARMARDQESQAEAETVAQCLTLAARILAALAESLRAGIPAKIPESCLAEMHSLAARLSRDPRSQVEALAGQLRAAAELASHVTPAGIAEFERREAARPPRLRLTGALAVLRANLSVESSAFRHAVRMGVCVGIGEAAAFALGWQRSYWIPMTIAIVLRPDFSSTFSRGVLRIAGTLFGLALSTALYHLLTPSLALQVALIGVLAFLLRCFGPANDGVFVTSLTALVVILVALTGVAPAGVIAARGMDTLIGGVVALLAYALWPTWERRLLPEALAEMLESYRLYFQAVRDAYLHPDAPPSPELERRRVAARRARSNLEESVARVRLEPGHTSRRAGMLDAILANSHRFIHAAMSLEAGLPQSRQAPPRPAFQKFADDVDRTLYFLVAALRGARDGVGKLPDLREDHEALIAFTDPSVDRYALVDVETDRITNSLNTLAGEVIAVLDF